MSAIRILCIDDDPRINELNQVVLTRAGYDVEVALSPSDALARLGAGTFFLVINDLFLPGSSDAAFISKMRSLASNMPFIVVNGNHNSAPQGMKQVDAL